MVVFDEAAAHRPPGGLGWMMDGMGDGSIGGGIPRCLTADGERDSDL